MGGDEVGTLGSCLVGRRLSLLKYDAVTFDATDARAVRPYKGLHVSL